MPELTPFELRKAEDASDAKLLGDVEREGWHVVQIFEEPGSSQFAFTVGLYYQFLQPEILIMGIDLAISAQILNGIGEAIRSGRKITPGRYDDFIEGFPVELAPIDLSFYEQYLGYATWFYRSLPHPYPAMQCIWPDKSGVFPNEQGYDTRFFQLQRLLTNNSEPVGAPNP
jgi:hypothetical protein